MQLQLTCFKVDKPNGKAMIHGFRKDGKVHRQCIWLEVKDRRFPALLTLQRSHTPFEVSPIGQAMDPDNFAMPLKYVVDLHCEYFVRNEMSLWRIVCSNGLFDIWKPEQPHLRFAKAKTDPAKFRIQLLRIYEIDHEFNTNDIKHASTRIDKLISATREVTIKAPVIPEDEFADLKRLCEQSVEPYLTRRPRLAPSVTLAEPVTDLRAREDIASLELEEEYFEGEKGPRLSSFYERNPRLRAAAVRHHGTVCKACEFDFGKVYGEIGDGFIEVHHRIPVGELSESRRVDPVSEMTVVCSNCHRMLHRKRDALLTPEQLSEIIGRGKGS